MNRSSPPDSFFFSVAEQNGGEYSFVLRKRTEKKDGDEDNWGAGCQVSRFGCF